MKTLSPQERRDLHERMENASKLALEAERAYLRNNGWTYTSSNNPRCVWRWEKETANGKVTATQQEAILQQEAIDTLDGIYDGEEVEG
jgi:hypothetical protein